MHNYSLNDIKDTLRKLPIDYGVPVFIHSNLFFFGRLKGEENKEKISEIFLEKLLERMGYKGTIIVPSFTYSYPKKQIFRRDISTPSMGMFSQFVQEHKNSLRSDDPCFSVSALGDDSLYLTQNLPLNSFGKDCFFDRFEKLGGQIINFNLNAGSTFIHFIEKCYNVKYRFDKTFKGLSEHNGLLQKTESTIFVRYRSDNKLEANFKYFDIFAKELDLFKTYPLGRGQIGIIKTSDCRKLINSNLSKTPLFLTNYGLEKNIEPLIVKESNYESNDY